MPDNPEDKTGEKADEEAGENTDKNTDKKDAECEKEDGGERRRYARKKSNLPLNILGIDVNNLTAITAIDISEGGLRISTPVKLDTDYEYEFIIVFEDSKVPIRTKCRIIWQKEIVKDKNYQAGVQFLDINQKDLDRIFLMVQFDGFAFL